MLHRLGMENNLHVLGIYFYGFVYVLPFIYSFSYLLYFIYRYVYMFLLYEIVILYSELSNTTFAQIVSSLTVSFSIVFCIPLTYTCCRVLFCASLVSGGIRCFSLILDFPCFSTRVNCFFLRNLDSSLLEKNEHLDARCACCYGHTVVSSPSSRQSEIVCVCILTYMYIHIHIINSHLCLC